MKRESEVERVSFVFVVDDRTPSLLVCSMIRYQTQIFERTCLRTLTRSRGVTKAWVVPQAMIPPTAQVA